MPEIIPVKLSFNVCVFKNKLPKLIEEYTEHPVRRL
jgi:hypothetical protein